MRDFKTEKKQNDPVVKKTIVFFLIMIGLFDEIGIDWSTDFLDRGDHLNLSGAERVTEYLGRFLNDHFRLADHRADAAYGGWEKESREYEEKASEGLSKIGNCETRSTSS